MDHVLGTQITLDRIGLAPGLRVLEVGPGPGRLLIPAARRVQPGGEVVGLEVQPGMIERLNTRSSQAGVSNLTSILGDAAQPNVPAESFDVVFLCTVLGEIPDRDAALQECYKALKPGGTLSITEIFPDPHYQNRAIVMDLCQRVGFTPDRYWGSPLSFTQNFIKPL